MTKTHFNSRYLGVLCFLAAYGIIFHTYTSHDKTINDPSTVFNKPAMFTVSYVTSFWAKEPNDKSHNPHRREVEAALMANIHNRYFDQIVVFLDGVTEQSNCIHFLEDMRNLHLKTGLYLLTHDDIFAKVTCVDVTGGQPPYYQMFMNAVSDFVLGDVVVMANADQAFDYSVEVAHNLNPDVLVMLGTRGFANAPQIIKYFYETLAGTEYIGNVGTAGEVAADICANQPYSWDTYIFHKNAVKDRLEEDAFKRVNMNNEKVLFYMNENGAENAALWGLQQSFEFKSLFNGCDAIHSWHFHLTPKTHKEHNTPWKTVGRSPQGSVPYPWGGYTGETECRKLKNRQKCRKSTHPMPSKNPPCVVENNCFLVSKMENNTAALQHSNEQMG